LPSKPPKIGQEKRDHPKRQEKRGSAASQEIPDLATAWDVGMSWLVTPGMRGDL